MTTKWGDRLGSGLMLVLVAVLWSQRNYMTPFGGIFPDRIMSILALLALVLFLRSFRPSPTKANEPKDAGLFRKTPSSARERAIFSPGKDGEAGDVGSIVDAAGCSQAEEGPLEARLSIPTGPNTTERNWLDLTAVGLLLLGWVLSLSTLGFLVTGVLGFSGISIFLARGKLNMKLIATSIGYALIMTYGLILIFAKLLLVPLPVGTLFE